MDRGVSDARCTRGLACKSVEKTHTSIQVQRRQSDIPCAMALRLISCSPRSGRAPCHRRCAEINRHNLTPASGRRDHTTLPYASRAVCYRHLRVQKFCKSEIGGGGLARNLLGPPGRRLGQNKNIETTPCEAGGCVRCLRWAAEGRLMARLPGTGSRW